MSRKQNRGLFGPVFVASTYFFTFLVGCSGRVGQAEDGFASSRGIRRIMRNMDLHRRQGHLDSVKPVFRDPYQRGSNEPGVNEPQPESTDSPMPHFNVVNQSTTFSWWTVGNVTAQTAPSPPDTEDGYQADFTDFHRVQGKVVGLHYDSSSNVNEWEAMKPFVGCNDNVMLFTASGQGFTHLLVVREGASPISVFQLPPYCGYSVKSSWSDLEMMVPYDACYITQENGSYVLPMLWEGIPVKLYCPMDISTLSAPLSPSAPSVFCSPFGMVVQTHVQEKDIPTLGIFVNGAWGPFVSENCAYRVNFQSPAFTFFIPFSAPCVTRDDDLHLQLTSDDQEYILSCPISPLFPSTPAPPSLPPLFHLEPQFPQVPDLVRPSPTLSPPPPSRSQPSAEAQISHHPRFPYFGFKHPQQSQVFPPGPQRHPPPQPTSGNPPGPQQLFMYLMGPGNLPYPLGGHQHYPPHQYPPPVIGQPTSVPDFGPARVHSPHQGGKLPVGPSRFPFGFPYVPFYFPTVTPALTPPPQNPSIISMNAAVPPPIKKPKPQTSPYYPLFYDKAPNYPSPAETPDTQMPVPVPPGSPCPPPSAPGPHYHHSLFYPPFSYFSYHPYWSGGLHRPSESRPAATPPLSPAAPSDNPRFRPFSQFNLLLPPHLPTPMPPANREPQKPMTSQVTCPPHTHTICGYYSYPHLYPHALYPLRYPPVPKYPKIHPQLPTYTPTTSPTMTPYPPGFTTPAWPSPFVPNIQCLPGRMAVFLPFAHPESIEVKDHMRTWTLLKTASPYCGYMLQMAAGLGVTLHSPLPSCHSESQTPTTISFPVRFWDLSVGHYRTVDLQCQFQSTPDPPGPVTPSVYPPTLEATVIPSVVPTTKVFCSSDQMIVELPPGSISEIVVEDLKGNQMNLQEAPVHCGYSARETDNGKIHLILQLHSRCLMSVQGTKHIINIIYMTADGKRETTFSCPVVIPRSHQECNLPSEQRLPCGSGSVSQPQCLSMGCCFDKHPPACYYPIDECTIDRHFVFSVPASLTEPPLSPALLVVASNYTCKPEKVTPDFALFKIPMDGCGTRRVVVGKTVVYLVEIINKVQTITLNYGTITRDSPVRLLVECRFVPGKVVSVSYMVKSPTLGPEIHTQGVFGVQLRIAKDAQYSSYYPQYHQPLQMLLGKPLHLEVRLLNSPDPSLVLLVHFCIAYPRSGKAVWVLLYNGCPNPLDPTPQQVTVFDPQPSSQIRRFTISTFQFLPDGEFKDPNEEIYFMCSTEICSPRDGPCVEECFGQ